MSALSFSTAVAVRPAVLGKACKAPRTAVNATTKALGGFGEDVRFCVKLAFLF